MSELIQSVSAAAIVTPSVVTEDLGKEFEMGICLNQGIAFDGKYKYSMANAEAISTSLGSFSEVFPHKLKHTAKGGNRYDFVGETDETIKLSAKTTKKDGKVSPQVIGQPSKKKFCNTFGLNETSSNEEIKSFIESNVSTMLSQYFEYTFDCPILYYNQHKNKLQFVTVLEPIDWSNQVIGFTHIKKNKVWNESTSISIGKISIGEFQVHNHRDCIKFRWNFEKVLDLFSSSFQIINL